MYERMHGIHLLNQVQMSSLESAVSPPFQLPWDEMRKACFKIQLGEKRILGLVNSKTVYLS
ncbi:hypothetical protein LV84_00660 [Algoriphagus ratkowskyi]|uniref:Uncharacterized protein n=1 Tax=Algoriphagus ratkowskyi TaxID=57028 RepID=A0A2W7RJ13_9BACT|nr:hypothetical protein LV84_00660 [Algoriphagus ratkowskyi]